MNKKVILFIPVSAPGGIGEYIRSVIIAEHISKKWPDSDIHFIKMLILAAKYDVIWVKAQKLAASL